MMVVTFLIQKMIKIKNNKQLNKKWHKVKLTKRKVYFTKSNSVQHHKFQKVYQEDFCEDSCVFLL